MKVWLHRSVGNDTGWNGWCLDLPGFATWAPSEDAVLARVPGKLAEHSRWLESHGLLQGPFSSGLDVAERVSGDEVLFAVDREAVPAGRVDLTIRLLAATRADLLKTMGELPEAALDWDPPYSFFAPWATWRSIRQILAHIANTETHYYLTKIGWRPRCSVAREAGDWCEFLAAHRAEVIDRLADLRDSSDLCRLRQIPDDEWSVSKVLRRLVRHEILHWKSIRRIAGQFQSIQKM